MTEPTDNFERDADETPPSLEQQLNAFADGELDASASLALMERLIGHGDRERALQFVRNARDLTLRTRRAAVRSSEAPSPELRATIASMLSDNAPPQAPLPIELRPSTTRRAWWRTGVAALAAAVAGVAIGVGTMWAYRGDASPKELSSNGSPARTGVVPSSTVIAMGRTHANCSRLAEGLHTATFEATNASLAAVVRAGLQIKRDAAPNASDAPDLSSIGFKFVGAGPCHHAGPGVVHLLYRSADPRSTAALSLFVQADTGQFDRLAADRVYRVTSGADTFPTLAWRLSGATYFLLADNEATSLAALQQLRPTPADAIVDATVIASAR
jgi:anti-sigma factor RsiW